MEKRNYDQEVEFGDDVSVTVNGENVSVKGKKGEVKRDFRNPRIEIKLEGNKIIVKCKSKKTSVRDKRDINTFVAHIKNLMKGVVKGYHAKVKVLSGHFPITASVEGNTVSVKNFLGEKIPRKTAVTAGVKATLQGDIILLEGVDKDAVAQCAARIEGLTRITDKDRRIFQDGCYIIEKPGDNEE